MPLKKYICIVFFCYPAASFSQLIESFREDFDKAKSGWVQNKTKDFETRIGNGFYYFEHFRREKAWHTYIEKFFSPLEEYEIEVTLTHLSGPINFGYGLMFGGRKGFYNLAEITSNGNFLFGKVVDNYFHNSSGLIPAPSVNKRGQENTIRIKKTNQYIDCYVNGAKVYRHKNPLTFYGDHIGFYIQRNLRIRVDHLIIRTPKKKINLVKAWDDSVVKNELSSAINTPYTEITPIISPNGKELYFSRKKDPENRGNKGHDDILVSKKNSDGKWLSANRLPAPVNNENHNYVCGVGAGGNTLLIGNVYQRDGSMTKGMSTVTKSSQGWRFPKPIEMEGYLNLENTSSNCWSVNQKIIVMSVRRDDGYGLYDLYVSFHEEGNTWSKPLNMGNSINSNGNEKTPFLAADNKTLYFSSDGHPGYGDLDIFVSRRLDDSWQKWSKPENLGPSFNNHYRNLYFSIAASGNLGYMVSNEKNGDLDIYEIQLHPSTKPDATLLISGTVKDQKTQEPIAADILIQDLTTNQEVGLVQSNPQTGYYEIVLPEGAVYSFYAQSDQYYSVRENIDLKQFKIYEEKVLDLFLSPLELGSAIKLNNVFFKQSKAELLKDSFAELDNLVKILKRDPLMEIRIEGHTDTIGDASLNQVLSEKRANAIRDYLINKGIDRKRITTVGLGGSDPIEGSDDPEKRKLNRRVEFRIVK